MLYQLSYGSKMSRIFLPKISQKWAGITRQYYISQILYMVCDTKIHKITNLLYTQMELPETETYTIKAGGANFVVQKSVFMYHFGKGPADDILNIGGDDIGVEFRYNKLNPTLVELQWFHNDQQTYTENDEDESTTNLFYVAVQILKLYTPVNHITFVDNSHFLCTLPDNSKVKTHLAHYYFLFHNGKTWYHDKLGAYPFHTEDRKRYASYVKNFTDPNMKQPTFYFNNDDLSQLFSPLWHETKTWKEFIHKIKDLPNICQKAYPWYYRAANVLMNGYAMPETWCIDVNRLQFAPIPFERIPDTIRKKNYVPDTAICLDYPIPSLCRNLIYL
jgi:hypothetical protein